jgi:hypothetical protein
MQLLDHEVGVGVDGADQLDLHHMRVVRFEMREQLGRAEVAVEQAVIEGPAGALVVDTVDHHQRDLRQAGTGDLAQERKSELEAPVE